jgi:hypothetical protein
MTRCHNIIRLSEGAGTTPRDLQDQHGDVDHPTTLAEDS